MVFISFAVLTIITKYSFNHNIRIFCQIFGDLMALTRFEKTRLISARALQLSVGAPALIKVDKNDSCYDLAKKELDKKLLPLSILRQYPNGKVDIVDI